MAERMAGVEVHHLGDGVRAEDLVDAGATGGDDALAFGDQQRGDVGEVELAAGVLVGEALEVGEERRGFEAVDAGVDLGGVVGGLERLLLDDGCDFGRFWLLAEDAAVAGGVGGTAVRMVIAARSARWNSMSARMVSGRMSGTSPESTRRLAGGLCRELEPGLDHLHRVAGAALLGLQDELDAHVLDGGRTLSASWPMTQ